jgi:hypothetical protein
MNHENHSEYVASSARGREIWAQRFIMLENESENSKCHLLEDSQCLHLVYELAQVQLWQVLQEFRMTDWS